jgi:hypothetical protein
MTAVNRIASFAGTLAVVSEAQAPICMMPLYYLTKRERDSKNSFYTTHFLLQTYNIRYLSSQLELLCRQVSIKKKVIFIFHFLYNLLCMF